MAALVFVLLVLSAWAAERQARAGNERALSAVASDVAGRKVHVQCQSLWKALIDVDGRLGDVPFPNGLAADRTHITRRMCGQLKRFRSASARSDLDCLASIDWSRYDADYDRAYACSRRANRTAEALMTLAHESMHLRGWADEASAQCYGLQELAYVTQQLGGNAEQGRAVTAYILAMQGGLPSEYQSGECRAGGAFDLHPDTPEFPVEAALGPPPAGWYGPQLAPA
ncbi:MAG: hypothetical protein M3R39_04200 [Actinomycetota bacterium]|nr:hypothetical protein [Actinomycetota bacterium]